MRLSVKGLLGRPRSESVFERIERTGVLRAGYINWPPLSARNPVTGRMEGLYVELAEALVTGLGWSIDWAEEVPLADFVAALDDARVDMMCAPMGQSISRVKQAYFAAPHFYAPYRPYVRVDDSRFDDRLDAVDTPQCTIAVMDGELSDIVARASFPHAAVLRSEGARGPMPLFEAVAEARADIVFQDPFTFAAYNRREPGRLRAIADVDVGYITSSFAVKFGEERLLRVVDAATQDLVNRRYLEQLARKYDLIEAGAYLAADGFKR